MEDTTRPSGSDNAKQGDKVLLETKVIKENRQFLVNLLGEINPQWNIVIQRSGHGNQREPNRQELPQSSSIIFPRYIDFAPCVVDCLHVFDKLYFSEAPKLGQFLQRPKNAYFFVVPEPFKGATLEQFTTFVSCKAARFPIQILGFDQDFGMLEIRNHNQKPTQISRKEEKQAMYVGRSLEGLDDITCFSGDQHGFSSVYKANRMLVFIPGFQTVAQFVQRLYLCNLSERRIQNMDRIDQLVGWIYSQVETIQGFSHGQIKANQVKNLTFLSLIKQMRLCPILESVSGEDILFSYQPTPEQDYFEDLVFARFCSDQAVNKALAHQSVQNQLDSILHQAQQEYLRLQILFSLDFIAKSGNQDFKAFLDRYDIDAELFDYQKVCHERNELRKQDRLVSCDQGVYLLKCAVYPVQDVFQRPTEHIQQYMAAQHFLQTYSLYAAQDVCSLTARVIGRMKSLCYNRVVFCDEDLLSTDPKRTMAILLRQNMENKQMTLILQQFRALFPTEEGFQNAVQDLRQAYKKELLDEQSFFGYVQSQRDLSNHFVSSKYTLEHGWESDVLTQISLEYVQHAADAVQYYVGHHLTTLAAGIHSSSQYYAAFCNMLSFAYRDQVYELVGQTYDSLRQLLFTDRWQPDLVFDFQSAEAQLRYILQQISKKADLALCAVASEGGSNLDQNEQLTNNNTGSAALLVEEILATSQISAFVIDIPERLSRQTRLLHVRLFVEQPNDSTLTLSQKQRWSSDIMLKAGVQCDNIRYEAPAVVPTPSLDTIQAQFFSILDKIAAVPEQITDLGDLLRAAETSRFLSRPDYTGTHGQFYETRKELERRFSKQLDIVNNVQMLFACLVDEIFDERIDKLIDQQAAVVNGVSDMPGFGEYISEIDGTSDASVNLILKQYLMSRQEAEELDGNVFSNSLKTVLTANQFSFLQKADHFASQRKAIDMLLQAQKGVVWEQSQKIREALQSSLYLLYARFRMYYYLVSSRLVADTVCVDLFAIDTKPMKKTLLERILTVLWAVEVVVSARAFSLIEYSSKLAAYAKFVVESTPQNPRDWCLQRKFVLDGFDFAYTTSRALCVEVERYDKGFFMHFGSCYGQSYYVVDSATGRKLKAPYAKIFNQLITIRFNSQVVVDFSSIYAYLYDRSERFGYAIARQHNHLQELVAAALDESKQALLEQMDADRNALYAQQTRITQVLDDFVRRTPKADLYTTDHNKFVQLLEQQKKMSADVLRQVQAFQARCEEFVANERYMGLSESDFSALQQLLPVLQAYDTFWALHAAHEATYVSIMRASFSENSAWYGKDQELRSDFEARICEFQRNAARLEALSRSTEDEKREHNYAAAFTQAALLSLKVQQDLRWFVLNIDIFNALCCPFIKKRHTTMLSTAGLVFEASVVSMNKLANRGIFKAHNAFDTRKSSQYGSDEKPASGGEFGSQQMTLRAQKILQVAQLAYDEHIVENRLTQIDALWQTTSLKLDGAVHQVGTLKTMLSVLQEDIYELRQLLQSQFAEYFQKKIVLTIDKLTVMWDIVSCVSRVLEKRKAVKQMASGLHFEIKAQQQIEFFVQTCDAAYEMLVGQGTLGSIFSMAGNFYVQDKASAALLRSGELDLKETNTSIVTTQLFVQLDAHSDYLVRYITGELEKLKQQNRRLCAFSFSEICEVLSGVQMHTLGDLERMRLGSLLRMLLGVDDLEIASEQQCQAPSSQRFPVLRVKSVVICGVAVSICGIAIKRDLLYAFDSITQAIQAAFVAALAELRGTVFQSLSNAQVVELLLRIRVTEALYEFFANDDVNMLCAVFEKLLSEAQTAMINTQAATICNICTLALGLNKTDPHFALILFSLFKSFSGLRINNATLQICAFNCPSSERELMYHEISRILSESDVQGLLSLRMSAILPEISAQHVLYGKGNAFSFLAICVARYLGFAVSTVFSYQFSSIAAMKSHVLRLAALSQWVVLDLSRAALSFDEITALVDDISQRFAAKASAAGDSSLQPDVKSRVFVRLHTDANIDACLCVEYAQEDVICMIAQMLNEEHVTKWEKVANSIGAVTFALNQRRNRPLDYRFVVKAVRSVLQTQREVFDADSEELLSKALRVVLDLNCSEHAAFYPHTVQPEAAQLLWEGAKQSVPRVLRQHLAALTTDFWIYLLNFKIIWLEPQSGVEILVELAAKLSAVGVFRLRGAGLPTAELFEEDSAGTSMLAKQLANIAPNSLIVVTGFTDLQIIADLCGDGIAASNGQQLKFPENSSVVIVSQDGGVIDAVRCSLHVDVFVHYLYRFSIHPALCSRVLELAPAIRAVCSFAKQDFEASLKNFIIVLALNQRTDLELAKDQVDELIYYAIYFGAGQQFQVSEQRENFNLFVHSLFEAHRAHKLTEFAVKFGVDRLEDFDALPFLAGKLKLLSADGYDFIYHGQQLHELKCFDITQLPEGQRNFIEGAPFSVQTAALIFLALERKIPVYGAQWTRISRHIAHLYELRDQSTFCYENRVQSINELVNAILKHQLEHLPAKYLPDPGSRLLFLFECNSSAITGRLVEDMCSDPVVFKEGKLKQFTVPALLFDMEQNSGYLFAFHIAAQRFDFTKVLALHQKRNKLCISKFSSFFAQFCSILELFNLQDQQIIATEALEIMFQSIDLLAQTEKAQKLQFQCALFLDAVSRIALYHGICMPQNYGQALAELRKQYNVVIPSQIFNYRVERMNQKQLDDLLYYQQNQTQSEQFQAKYRELASLHVHELQLQQDDLTTFEKSFPSDDCCIHYAEFSAAELQIIYHLGSRSLAVTGGAGIGKTLAIYMAAKHLGFEVVELKSDLWNGLIKAAKKALSKRVLLLINQKLDLSSRQVLHDIMRQQSLSSVLPDYFALQNAQAIKEHYLQFAQKVCMQNTTEVIPKTSNHLLRYFEELMRHNLRVVVSAEQNLGWKAGSVKMQQPTLQFLEQKFNLGKHLHLCPLTQVLYEMQTSAFQQLQARGAVSLDCNFMALFQSLLYFFDWLYTQFQKICGKSNEQTIQAMREKIHTSLDFCTNEIQKLSNVMRVQNGAVDDTVLQLKRMQQNYELEVQEVNTQKDRLLKVRKGTDSCISQLQLQFGEQLEAMHKAVQEMQTEEIYVRNSRLYKGNEQFEKIAKITVFLFTQSLAGKDFNAKFRAILDQEDFLKCLSACDIFSLPAELAKAVVNEPLSEYKKGQQKSDPIQLWLNFLQPIQSILQQYAETKTHAQYIEVLESKKQLESLINQKSQTLDHLQLEIQELKEKMADLKMTKLQNDNKFKVFQTLLERLQEVQLTLSTDCSLIKQKMAPSCCTGNAVLLAAVFAFTQEFDHNEVESYFKEVMNILSRHGIEYSDFSSVDELVRLAEQNYSWFELNGFPAEPAARLKVVHLQAILRNLREIPVVFDPVQQLSSCLNRYGSQEKQNQVISGSAITSADQLRMYMASSPVLIVRLDEETNAEDLITQIRDSQGQVIFYTEKDSSKTILNSKTARRHCCFLRMPDEPSRSQISERLLKLVSEDKFLHYKKLQADLIQQRAKADELRVSAFESADAFSALTITELGDAEAMLSILDQFKRGTLSTAMLNNQARQTSCQLAEITQSKTLATLTNQSLEHIRMARDLGVCESQFISAAFQPAGGFWEQFEYTADCSLARAFLYKVLERMLPESSRFALQIREITGRPDELFQQIKEKAINSKRLEEIYGVEFTTFAGLSADSSLDTTAWSPARLAAFCLRCQAQKSRDIVLAVCHQQFLARATGNAVENHEDQLEIKESQRLFEEVNYGNPNIPQEIREIMRQNAAYVAQLLTDLNQDAEQLLYALLCSIIVLSVSCPQRLDFNRAFRVLSLLKAAYFSRQQVLQVSEEQHHAAFQLLVEQFKAYVRLLLEDPILADQAGFIVDEFAFRRSSAFKLLEIRVGGAKALSEQEIVQRIEEKIPCGLQFSEYPYWTAFRDAQLVLNLMGKSEYARPQCTVVGSIGSQSFPLAFTWLKGVSVDLAAESVKSGVVASRVPHQPLEQMDSVVLVPHTTEDRPHRDLQSCGWLYLRCDSRLKPIAEVFTTYQAEGGGESAGFILEK